jgi:hypothetical protein
MTDAATTVDGLTIANVLDVTWVSEQHKALVAQYQGLATQITELDRQKQVLVVGQLKLEGAMALLTHMHQVMTAVPSEPEPVSEPTKTGPDLVAEVLDHELTRESNPAAALVADVPLDKV